MHLHELDDDQAASLLAACKAILTLGGEHPLGELETRTLCSLSRDLLQRPGVLDPDEIDIERAARNDCLAYARDDDELRMQCVGVLGVMPLVGETLDEARVAFARRLVSHLGDPPKAIDDVIAITQDRVFMARVCLFRRAIRDIFHRGVLETFGGLILSAGDGEVFEKFRALEELPEGSFGREIFNFYRDNLFTLPGERGLQGNEVVAQHDIRHVLAGYGTTLHGEFAVAAFEAGAHRRPMTDNVVCWFLHTHQAIPIFEPGAGLGKGTYDPDVFFREVARGLRTDPIIMTPDWNYLALAPLPLAEVRKRLGIPPGGVVVDGVDWRGPDALPYPELPLDHCTILPEGDAQLLALRVGGSLSSEDIAALDNLFSRRCYGGKRLDFLVDIEDDQGFEGAQAMVKDFAFAFKHRGHVRRLALVSDQRWQKWFVQLDRPFAKMFGIDERYFPRDQFTEAVAFCRGDG